MEAQSFFSILQIDFCGLCVLFGFVALAFSFVQNMPQGLATFDTR